MGWGGRRLEFGNSRCKLLYIDWVNKVLLYSTGSYIQYPAMNHNGKENEKNKRACLVTFFFSSKVNFTAAFIHLLSKSLGEKANAMKATLF